LNVAAGLGWTGFISLFLGWLAAMFGASAGAGTKVEAGSNVRDIRSAA
jgi:hypothetical protein